MKYSKSIIRIIFLTEILLQIPFASRSQFWSDVGGGMCDWVNASVVYNGELVVGGRFTCAGGVSANYIAKWNGTSWSALGNGTDGWVDALTVYNGELIAGGSFANAGGVPANNIARWDGTTWSDVSGGTNAQVASLAVYNNQLIAGGYFTDAEGVPCNYIGAWDQNGWYTLGTGMGGGQGQVMALSVHGSDLIAAGFFTTAGGVAADHIAKWDGSSWTPLGSGISWITYSLCDYNGDLIAGGYYTMAGGISANRIAKWDGTTWSALGSGMAATPVGYNYVFALAEYNGSLYAGGMYDSAGGVLSHSIAKWDGSSWTDLQGGIWYGGSNVYAVNSLTVFNNDLYAGGIFTSAGSTGVAHIAKWNEPPAGINHQDENSSVINLLSYPNPFKLSTDIELQIIKSGNLFLSLNDMSGRTIKILKNEFMSSGVHSIKLEGNNLANGVYLMKCISQDEVHYLNVVKY